MNVYIEYVVIDNLVITALIALISCRLLRIKAERFRVVVASLVGTIAAVVYPLLKIHAWWLFSLKIALLYILSAILFYKKTKLFRASMVFLGVTAAFGGVLFLIGYTLTGDVVTALTMPAFDFSIGIILLVPILMFFVSKLLIKNVQKTRLLKSCSFGFEMTVLNKTISGLGFLDTGNLLTDAKTGLPVVIAGAALSTKILGEHKPTETDPMPNLPPGEARYIDYNSVKGGGRLLILPVKNFRLYSAGGTNIIKGALSRLPFEKTSGEVKEVMLGISSTGFNGFDALLPSAVL